MKRTAETLGLSTYEAATYDALLRGGLLGVSNISKAADVPRGRIYDILQQLTAKGFCTLVPGAVKKYRAVDPEVAVKFLIETQQQDAALREAAMLRAAGELKELFMRNQGAQRPNPLDYVEVLTSRQSILRKVDELMDRSERTLRSFNKPPYAMGTFDVETIDPQCDPQRRMFQRGVKVKAIYEIETEPQANSIALLRHFDAMGEEVRVSARLPLKMIIIDSHTALLSLRVSHGKSSLTSIVVEHSDVALALNELFDLHWYVAKPLDQYLESVDIEGAGAAVTGPASTYDERG